MTMIAFATYGDRAEFITDSASYTANGAALGTCTKALPLPHLDMAVLTQGDATFGWDAKHAVAQISGQVATFDELVAETAGHLRTVWSQRTAETSAPIDGLVFLIGYSPALGRFAAWSFASDRADFKPARVDAPFVMPSPWSLRPDLLQVKRYREWDADAARHHGVEPHHPKIIDAWLSRPPLAAPGDVNAWVDLACRVRTERAATDYASIYVAGDVLHTTIRRGEVTTARIHTYDDSGAEFLAMIAGTQHPIAQLMPCWCESGRTYLECHLADQLDEPCGCHSAQPFGECCAVTNALRKAS